ncbi:MAG: ribonuclease J [bacterium]|nr:ribonuclease J [bacterium]
MEKLRFIAISGTTSVTQNLYIYEYGNDMIVVDCGIGFPEDVATFGIDLEIPDFSYIVKNKNKLRAIFVTHAHEDHFGALPFLFQEVSAPIYATRLTAAFIEDKFIDYNVRKPTLNVFDPEKDTIKVGSFEVSPFRVTHSVPDAAGLCIKTPVGKVFHVPDYKFDWTPVSQKTFDISRAAQLTSGGVLALASDSLGATSDGYTKSELDLERNIEVLVEEAKGRVFFTTLSSNISRMQQAINVSTTLGRKVVFVGRSTERKAEIAKKLGYLNYSEGTVISGGKVPHLPPNKITYIISGSYGQADSALSKVARGEHKSLKIDKGDVVIFSADPAPPGTEQAVNKLVDILIESGADVHYYDTQEDLHVSGHGSQKEIEMLLALIEPRFLIPIGGTVRHMLAFRELAQKMGWKEDEVFELRAGGSVEFSPNAGEKGPTVPVRSVLVDGLGVGDVGAVVLGDRKILAKEGVVVVVLRVGKSKDLVGSPELISRGFVFAKTQQGFLHRGAEALSLEIRKKGARDEKSIKETTTSFLEHFFFEETGRRPMILPVVVEV